MNHQIAQIRHHSIPYNFQFSNQSPDSKRHSTTPMAESQSFARTPDWSILPPELLQIIAKKLPDISDFVKFRAVCTTWRSSACISDPPPQLPWFLEEQDLLGLEGDLRFYSLFSGKIHTVPSPNLSNNWLGGRAHDYIILYNAPLCQFSLLNPLTGRKVVLPFLDIAGPHPVWVGPDPIESGEVVVLSGNSADFKTGILALYQPVEREWVVIEESCSFHRRDAYFNGMYYANEEETGDTKVISTVTRKVLHVVPPPPEDENEGDPITGVTYLVQSSGDILRVVLHDNELIEVADCRFYIYRLDLRSGSGGNPRWVKISSIGDQILFLDDHNGFSLSCNDFSGFRGNSIYFIKWHSQDIYDPPLSLLCRYDIAEARAEPLNFPFTKGGTWIVPSLR
ncbi:F-box family protein [Rhynchospora pubera]|uniref:F-box family protein n=1 Tax=Rhynchospora pubera TaxID=906938 RepID=A0AAV8H379_9POAL|nr:F-box family protein [Rhynchospora pubera]